MRHGATVKGRAWRVLTACALATAVLTAVPDTGSVAAPVATAVPSIVVTPSSGLVSGQVVTVTGSGFTPSAQVVLSDCLTETTLGFCGGIPLDSVMADSSGNFTHEFRVARGTFDESVYPPMLVDCARAPEACSVFAFVGFPVEKASAPISFDADAPPPSAVVTVTPSGVVEDGQILEVTGSGFSANANVFVGQCALGARADFLASPCGFPGGIMPLDSQGNLSTSIAVKRLYPLSVIVDGRKDVDCSTAPGACFVRVTSMTEPLETVDTPITFASSPTVVAGPTPVEAPPAFTG